jgi:predicted  nucleic acid-binding Zn-ribbon protein
VPDTKTRLLEAQRALDRLELQIEQYQLHLAELSSQAYEADKTRAVLTRMTMELEWQQKYYELLRNAAAANEDIVLNGSRAI